jgi:hypothetical protein
VNFWNPSWFGFVVPFVPAIFGAGRRPSDVEVYVTAVGREMVVVPESILARPTRSDSDHVVEDTLLPPTKCVRLGSENGEREELLPLDQQLTLAPGEGIELTFPMQVATTREFEVSLPAAAAGPERRNLRFRDEVNRTAWWVLLPVPIPSLQL